MALDLTSIPVDVSQFHESIGCLSVSGLAQYNSLMHFDVCKQSYGPFVFCVSLRTLVTCSEANQTHRKMFA